MEVEKAGKIIFFNGQFSMAMLNNQRVNHNFAPETSSLASHSPLLAAPALPASVTVDALGSAGYKSWDLATWSKRFVKGT